MSMLGHGPWKDSAESVRGINKSHEFGLIDTLGDNPRPFAPAETRERCVYQFFAARSGYASYSLTEMRRRSIRGIQAAGTRPCQSGSCGIL